MDPTYIQAGELIHVVTVQSPPDGRDETGQPDVTWDDVLTTRAKIESVNSRTFRMSFANNALTSQTSNVITMRHPRTVKIEPGYRVVFGDRFYTIQAIDNVLEQDKKLVLACIGIDEDSN